MKDDKNTMKILKLGAYRNRYGGNLYERLIGDINSTKWHTTSLNLLDKGGILSFFKKAYSYAQKPVADVIIRDFASSIFLNKKPIKNIVIIHHVDSRYSPLPSKLFQKVQMWALMLQKKRVDTLVVVAKYWKDFFLKRGFKNIKVIYNPFEIEKFHITDSQVEAFKQKYHLTDKPIIYLGNAQKKKGTDRAYRILKEIDAHFITSGKPHITIPCRNLDLPYNEYLVLLKAADVVVTMSLFKEGWNRVAHEAMLCHTPVVGSGSGGMKELLEHGGQLCATFDNLKEKVLWALDNPINGEKGYSFAKKFDIERFNDSWNKLLEEYIS